MIGRLIIGTALMTLYLILSCAACSIKDLGQVFLIEVVLSSMYIIISGFCISVWLKDSFKNNFKVSLSYAYLFISTISLIGYMSALL